MRENLAAQKYLRLQYYKKVQGSHGEPGNESGNRIVVENEKLAKSHGILPILTPNCTKFAHFWKIQFSVSLVFVAIQCYET